MTRWFTAYSRDLFPRPMWILADARSWSVLWRIPVLNTDKYGLFACHDGRN